MSHFEEESASGFDFLMLFFIFAAGEQTEKLKLLTIKKYG